MLRYNFETPVFMISRGDCTTATKGIFMDLYYSGYRPRGYKTFFMLNSQLSMKIFLLMNVKMPTIVGILTFANRKKAFSAYLSLKKAEFLDIFILMSI